MRSHNLSLVMRHIRDHPGSSRSDVASATGLTKAGVTKVVAELMRRNLVGETPAPVSGGRGRPPTQLVLTGHRITAVGVEIRIDHVGAIVQDLSGARLGEARVLLNLKPEPRKVVGLVRDTIAEAMRQADRSSASGIGIAVGATMDSTRGVVVDSSWLGWRDVALRELFTSELPQDMGRVSMEPVAGLSALATSRATGFGTAGNLLHVEIGGGAGAGVITDGRLSVGARGFAGNLGHIPFAEGGRRCACGNRGCLDTVVGFEAFRRASGGRAPRQPMNYHEYAQQVHAKAVAGDEHARAAIRDVANGLARAITTVTAVLDPDAVTLGGYVLDLADLFLDDLRAALRRYSSPRGSRPVDVIPTPLGERSPILGAAMLSVENIFEDPTSTTTPHA
ncbi:ROK family protein [Actinopolymorpha pittospori]